MTKTTPAPRVRALNLYTVESNGKPVAQAMAISQAEAVRLYVESVQQPTMTARLSSPLEARTLAGLPLLRREPAAVYTRTADLFEGVPPPTVPAVISREPDPETVDAAHEAERAIAAAHEIPDAEFIAAVAALPTLAEAAELFAEPAADHVEDSRAMVERLGDCGRATQTCGRDGCGAEVIEMPPQHAPIAAVVEGLASGAQEPAAEQPGEPAGCPGAAPTAVESAGASSAVDDDGGRELTAAEQAAYEEQGAARFERHHGGELKRQAETATARAGGKIVAKYRDPATSQAWSGRGLKPRWLVQALEDGKTLDEFLIENQGAHA